MRHLRPVRVILVLAAAMILTPAASPPVPGDGVFVAPRTLSAAPRWHDDARLAFYLAVQPDRAARASAISAFRQGLEATRGERPGEAVAAFERAANDYPYIGDWARVFAADAAARAGDTAAVRRLQAEAGTALAVEWGWQAQLRARHRAGDSEGAIRRAIELASEVESDPRRAAIFEMAGEIQLLRGDTAAAKAAFREAIATSTGSDGAFDAARELSALPGLTPDDRLAIGRVYLRQGSTERGVDGLDAYLESGRGSAATRAAIRLEAGRALFAGRRYEDAARRLIRLADSDPAPDIAAEALFLAGRALYREERETAAREVLARATREYPGTVIAAQIHFYLGDLDQDDGRLESARAHFLHATRVAPASEAAALAFMRLGIMEMTAYRPAEAAKIFDAYRAAATSDGNRQQAAYWAGRAWLATGAADSLGRARLREAREADPIDYYGLQASRILGVEPLEGTVAAEPPTDAEQAAQVANAVRRLDFLQEIGLEQAGAFEMLRLRRHFQGAEGAMYALAEAFAERGEASRAIRIGRDMLEQRGVWDPRLLRIVFPLPYEAEIRRSARAHGLDPFLVAGLIRQESMFEADARSGPGALGLMQVMPKTGKILAKKERISRFTAATLTDPAMNLRLGTLYLKDMIREHGGLVPTLAAYNAGPTRVARWSRFPEARDPELLTERIPFEETREYVRVVQRNALLYSSLYAD